MTTHSDLYGHPEADAHIRSLEALIGRLEERIRAVLNLCDVETWEGENAGVLAERVRDLLAATPDWR